jgi:hypothetical protein
MAIVATDWTIDRDTKVIAYIGDDHTGTAPSYATVIQFHRWLQQLADDAVAIPASGDELDITNVDPSRRSTDNIITLINGYTLNAAAPEHLYDGSIIQGTVGVDQIIWDGVVNFGNSDVQIQLIQDGAVLTDDWWNTRDKVYGDGGLNYDDDAGISHRFMLKVHDFVADGGDIDGRRVIGTARRFGYTYQEFKINGSARGNNVLALADGTDLNNQTAIGTVAGWTGITLVTEGYVGLDINDDATVEYFYSEWNTNYPTNTINNFYERMKWLTRDGSASTFYGLNGELFRGITHEVAYTSLTGTFDEGYGISWSGASVGTGQILADNGSNKLWIQLLTGVAPVSTASLSQTTPDAASATAGTITDRSALISKPFIGVSTGTQIIGAYGVGIQPSDINSGDKVFDLSNAQWSPPNLVTNSVTGVVIGEDYILVAPAFGTDTNGDPAIDKNQFEVGVALTTDNVTSVTIQAGRIEGASIPTDTPSTGYIRVTDNNGFERKLHYSSWTGSVFTIDTTDGNEDFLSVNASIGNNVYITYLDLEATATSHSYQGTYVSDRNLVVLVRDGKATPIKQFISGWTFGSANQSIAVIRTTDE